MANSAVARRTMVDNQLRTSDVTSYPVLDAMGEIPRETFVPSSLASLAYIDQHLLVKPAEGGAPPRYLMQPAPFARLVQLAAVGPGDRVLVVGAGTGYPAAVIATMGASVTSLECDPSLAEQATRALAGLGIAGVESVVGPLEAGWSANAPYDVILVVGAVEVLPKAITDQLADRGRLVVVEGEGLAARAMLYTRTASEVSGRAVFNCSAKALPGFQRTPEFTF